MEPRARLCKGRVPNRRERFVRFQTYHGGSREEINKFALGAKCKGVGRPAFFGQEQELLAEELRGARSALQGQGYDLLGCAAACTREGAEADGGEHVVDPS